MKKEEIGIHTEKIYGKLRKNKIYWRGMLIKITKGKNKRIGRIDINVGYFNEKKFKGYHLSYTSKKMKAVALAQVKLAKKGHVYLRVKYDRWNFNHGVYNTISQFKKALSDFTEISLVKHIMTFNKIK